MFIGNRLKAGDFLTFVPVGLPVTLQYDLNGNLEKVYYGVESGGEELTKKILSGLINHPSVPYHIPMVKGTSWVRGVLYTSAIVPKVDGELPVAIKDNLIDKFIQNPALFNFFAGEVTNSSAQFKGAVATRQWLNMCKFHVLPGLIVTSIFDMKRHFDFVHSQAYTFRPDLVAGYIVYRRDDVSYYTNSLYQHHVEGVSVDTDVNGYIHGILSCSDHVLKLDYSDCVRRNIQPNSVVVTWDGEVCFNECVGKSSIAWANQYECPYCHKYIAVPNEGAVHCDNAHCKSNLLGAVKQFLSIMTMPKFSDEDMHSWIEDNLVTCVPDLFIIPEYKEFEVKATLARLLRAIIPLSEIHSVDVIQTFVNKCSNKADIVEFYAEHPEKISTELGLSGQGYNELINWFNGDYNLVDLQTLLHTENIKFVDTNKAFQGAPIFRGKMIYITGRFLHGSHSRIAEILSSYDASVSLNYYDDVSIILVGDTQEEIDGQAIQRGRAGGKVIISESEFFRKYDIDADLQENLV